MNRLPWFLIVFFLGVSPAMAISGESEKFEVTVVNAARVYHPVTACSGDQLEVVKVGTVVSLTVFNAIPEYQEIKRRNLDPTSAEYLLFMKKASDRFSEAVTKTVQHGRYEMVAEVGAITVKDHLPPDITSEIVRHL
jgi:hypothetical protein